MTLARMLVLAAAVAAIATDVHRFDGGTLSTARIDEAATRLMRDAGINGLAMAVVDVGQVAFTGAWGYRNVEKKLPLQTDTVMYGASLTKFVFAYTVMQFVDEGKLDLDRPIAAYLPKPLPEYEFYAELKNDERWRRITPRILLMHASGLANYAFLEPDQKMRLHFDPGTRYAYSGEGIILLQFVLETGLGLNVGDEMQRRVFDRFGMTRTSMTWRAEFAENVADGYSDKGAVTGHSARRRPRASGSMDTTIADFAKFLAAFTRGEGLSPRSRAEMTRAQLPIATPAQFPTLTEERSATMTEKKLAAGLGVVTFEGPFGRAFFKGGHDDVTGNQAFCVERQRRCVVYLSNDVRAEGVFQRLTEATLGDPGMPWAWENYQPYDRNRVK